MFRTRVSTGKELLPGIDGRSRWARRLHDLIANHVEDMGGPLHVSQAQFLLIKAAATTAIVLEKMEVKFAKQDGASFPEMLSYMSVLNSLRRTFESLGLERSPEAVRGTAQQDWSRWNPDLLEPKDAVRCKRLMHRWENEGTSLPEPVRNDLVELLDQCPVDPRNYRPLRPRIIGTSHYVRPR
jgi:hypothetical protein